MLRVGVNYPWINYDWDFGEPPRDPSGAPWGPRAAWRGRLPSDLERFREIGAFAVRWWVLGSGLLYGTGPDAPRRVRGVWTVPSAPRLSDAIVADFADALPLFRSAGLLVLPVFVDFPMFLDPDPGATAAPGYVKGGRAQLMAQSPLRRQFLERALQPLLEAARPYADVIYGWDLINEPEWCVRSPGLGVPRGPRPTLRRLDMLAFLRDGLRMINDAGFRSSIGFAHHATLRAWQSIELGVRLHQFHYYGEPSSVPPHTFHPENPVIVGELAAAPHPGWPDLTVTEAPPAPSGDMLFNRLRHLDARGYPAAFVWPAREMPAMSSGEEPHAAWWDERAWGQIKRFTQPPSKV